MDPVSTAVDLILAQVSNVITLMIDVMGDLLANPFFAFLFACGFVRIGMSLIKKAKKASRQDIHTSEWGGVFPLPFSI